MYRMLPRGAPARPLLGSGKLPSSAEGEHLPGAFVVLVISHSLVSHACIPFIHGSSALKPRYTRDFTVPSGAPVTTAISSNDIPS